MQVPFVKMQGAGNRIVVIDQRTSNLAPPPASLVQRLGDEATGPGFDQLMWLSPPRGPGAAASYRVFNADGSEVEQCGNGVRCVARLLATRSRLPLELRLESPAGLVEARVQDDGLVAVNMGLPTTPQEILLPVGNETVQAATLSMGNPHCVIEVPDVATASIDAIALKIGESGHFPDGVNVGFRHIADRDNIDLRVHERGVGETLACGTGACAAVVAGRHAGLLDESVAVRLPGGQLMVSWRGENAPVWLTGNAEFTSEGTVDL